MGKEQVIPQLILIIKKIIKKNPKKTSFNFPILGDGSQIRSFNYISDFSRGVALILRRGKNKNIYQNRSFFFLFLKKVKNNILMQLKE